uniref:Golgi associated RAB2 interactor protein-like Rab2B-binding domain-containing protein n=1 Tax=Salvator merianae TaxID=96440 RepID=A0A8D0KG43_SALMN
MAEESRAAPDNRDPRASSYAASKGLFNTAMGPLQRQLRAGEYNLFKCATMFESDFVQVSKRGGTLDVHNQVQLVRVAIAATSPGLQVPNVLLLARPTFPPEQHQLVRQVKLRHPSLNTKFELTRLLPLCFVKISVHDLEKKQLRFKMATGRTFYLQLCPPLDAQADNFDSWVRVVHLLRPPAELKQEKKEQAEELWVPERSAAPMMEVSALKEGVGSLAQDPWIPGTPLHSTASPAHLVVLHLQGRGLPFSVCR